MRIAKLMVLTVSVASLSVAACDVHPASRWRGSGSMGNGGTVAVVPPPTSLTITRTGGFAGVMQVVAIAADGTWTFTDRRAGTTQQGTFTAAQREELTRLAADPAVMAESRAGGPKGVCNDGYIYTITVGEMSIRYEQCGDASKRPVTDQLLTVVRDGTPM